jgi:hypothetical protein
MLKSPAHVLHRQAFLNYASAYTLIPDLGLEGQRYSWVAAIFNFGYLRSFVSRRAEVADRDKVPVLGNPGKSPDTTIAPSQVYGWSHHDLGRARYCAYRC